MSIASAITAAQQKVEACYTQVAAQGGTIPTTKNLANLPQAISTVSEVMPETKYGASIDTLLGDIDANGVLQYPSGSGALKFDGVKVINKNYMLAYKFQQNTHITSVDMSSLTSISGNSATNSMFSNCSGITSVDLSALTSISGSNTASAMFTSCSGITSIDISSLTSVSGSSVTNNMFTSCSRITSVDISSLTSVSGSSAISSMFSYCSGITSVDISSLTSISGSNTASSMFSGCSGVTSIDISALTSISGSSAISSMFASCAKLPSIRFPMLQTSDTNSWTTNTFNTVILLTEIHFRKDMADVVPTFTGYSTKWGATNATIYFDLVGKITVGGVEYMRSEQDSIRINHVKQYVGWTNKTITVGGTVYTRDSSKDTVKDSGYGSTYYSLVYGWTNGSTTLYTKDRLPTTASGVYTNIEATTSAGTISAVSTNDIVYTAFDDTTKAEPDVGTTVYSDAGQTSIGTITAIA